MPTFDYTCTDCTHVFEYSKPFGSTVTPVCPQCNSTITKKSIHIPGISFKGTGFYVNDSQVKHADSKSNSKQPNTVGTSVKTEEATPKPAEVPVKTESKT